MHANRGRLADLERHVPISGLGCQVFETLLSLAIVFDVRAKEWRRTFRSATAEQWRCRRIGIREIIELGIASAAAESSKK